VVYHQKLVACIKVNGKVLREIGDTVTLPFGSEYSILLKNLNSVRVQAKVYVDGQDATEGTWLVIPANGSIELERFIRNGNLAAGNRLKFIARSKKVEAHRGLRAEDGLVRVEYRTERVFQTQDVYINCYRYHDCWSHYPWWGVWNGLNSGIITKSSSSGGSGVQATYTSQSQNCGALNSQVSLSVDNSGITVPGSESNQTFTNAPSFSVHEQSEVLVLKLRGEVGGKRVEKPVTVKSKPKCQTCGKVNKATSKFCADCGTALTLL
jgi:hypothetical protein